MEIKILKPLKKSKTLPKNQYKFKIELMGGDADAYAYFTEKVLVDKNDPNLERFITFLENCKKRYPKGKGGDDDYTDVKDYYVFVGGGEYPGEIEENGEWRETNEEDWECWDQESKEVGFGFDWEGNEEYFGVSSFQDYTVTYFDENSKEYKVEIKL